MQVEQSKWSLNLGWEQLSNHQLREKAQLVLAFGNENVIKDEKRFEEIKEQYPKAEIITCCTDGEILNELILNDGITLSAIYFKHTQIQTLCIPVSKVKDSFDAGTHLSADLEKDHINSLLIFGDSQALVASDLLMGIGINLASHVPILGGLSTSHTGLNSIPKHGTVIGVGFSGDKLKVGHSVDQGWTTLGAEKTITKAVDQRVYEIDDKACIHFYEQYLAGIVSDVKSRVIEYPLGIKNIENSRLVRSMLEIHDDGSITFAGSFRNGDQVRMMKSSTHKLLLSSELAAEESIKSLGNTPEFVLQFNCVGRRQVLKDWLSEEQEYINSKFEKSTPMMGFYSHGEIAPLKAKSNSELHNQSVVFNTFCETE
ncbi:FIST signal transduction protein [Reichenbachiella ulvae]|uniref:FIST C-terminal domain-containing protein n=1 Tax=Reichenbachiella ulvae TaxID=2980104 RepID=A0ABT3CR71_9BACT|nr:FIST N-terminal domain-containing protein [Reichenbachiella ulvae]MCV9386200.1 FIST C-terminal domain-containing protein [Reichenbachiella ulvae]